MWLLSANQLAKLRLPSTSPKIDKGVKLVNLVNQGWALLFLFYQAEEWVTSKLNYNSACAPCMLVNCELIAGVSPLPRLWTWACQNQEHPLLFTSDNWSITNRVLLFLLWLIKWLGKHLEEWIKMWGFKMKVSSLCRVSSHSCPVLGLSCYCQQPRHHYCQNDHQDDELIEWSESIL